MPMRRLNWKAWLRNGQFFAACGNTFIRRRRKDQVEFQLLEIGSPERKTVVKEHSPRNTYSFGSALQGFVHCLDKLFAIRNQIFNDRRAIGARTLSELVRALIPPVSLFAVDLKLLHLAIVGTGFTDEIVARELHAIQFKSPKTCPTPS